MRHVKALFKAIACIVAGVSFIGVLAFMGTRHPTELIEAAAGACALWFCGILYFMFLDPKK